MLLNKTEPRDHSRGSSHAPAQPVPARARLRRIASMPSDQTVTARDVLRALADVRRRGTGPALAEFEQLEPDLAEFLIEEVTAIHHDVAAIGARARRVRALTERVETLAVVLVRSLRQAHLRLWED